MGRKKKEQASEPTPDLLPIDDPLTALSSQHEALKEELMAEPDVVSPLTSEGEDTITLSEIIERAPEGEEYSTEIGVPVEEVEAATGKKSKGKGSKAVKPKTSKEKGTSLKNAEGQEIPVPKYNMVTAEELQKEIRSVTLEQGLEIQRARRVYRSGSVGIDVSTGQVDPIKKNGGYCELTIMELYGGPGMRKTNFFEHMGFNILEDDPNNIVVFFYTEDPHLERLHRECRLRGMPIETVGSRFQVIGLYNPETPDAKLQTAEKRLMDLVLASRYDNVKMIVIDSLKALVSVLQMYKKDETGKETIKPFEDEEVALRAKLMEKLFNRLLFQRRRAILGMTNHQTERIPNRENRFKIHTGQDRTPAGTMKEYLSMVRIEVTGKPIYDSEKIKIGADKDSEHCPQEGILQIYKIKKNRWGRPNIKVVVPFDFELGRYDQSLEILYIGSQIGLIKQAGSYYTFGDVRCQGKEDALCYLDEHPDVKEALYLKIIEYGPKIYQARPGEVRGNISVTDIIEPNVPGITIEPDIDPETGDVLNADQMLDALQLSAG